MPTMTVEATGSLSTIDRDEWDALANPGWVLGEGGRLSRAAGAGPGGQPGDQAFNPFVAYDFLRALEDAGCVGGRSGWYQRHLVIKGAEGALLGAAPAYLKTHSKGEYVFDYGWADAFERAGGQYYPKLQVSVPFTPANGPRLLVGNGPDEARLLVAQALKALAEQSDASSVHATFLSPADRAAFEAEGYLMRTDTQFHFTNDGYATPDDFLAALASRKRKQVKRERRDALADGITVRWLTGDDITEDHWDAFYQFYMDTGSRKWGRPYLNRTFFSLLGERMRHCVCLMIAEREGRPIAGALNLIGSDALYGRYWGCTEDHPFLHFEVCYYQAIDFAIAHKLARVEAGAQGGHKLARGYEPTQTVSAHYIDHPGLRDAIARYLEGERAEVAAHQEYMNAALPFRRDGNRHSE